MSITCFAAIHSRIIHYRREGQFTNAMLTGIPLVFINSLGSDLRIWDGVVPYFAEAFPLIRYDKRGHGLSDCPPGPYTLRDHTNDLAELLTVLEVSSAILIGVSVGGMIALDFAQHYPHRVHALVLCDTGARIGAANTWTERSTIVRQEGLEPIAPMILGRWFSRSFSTVEPAAYRGYYNMLTRTPVEGYAATCEALRDTDLREVVKNIAVPALVLCGDEDMATPPALGQELAAALPNARFQLIYQAAHLPSIEQPRAVAGAIKQFFKELHYV